MYAEADTSANLPMEIRLAGLLRFEDLAALIVSALRASAMGHLGLVTVRALAKRVSRQMIVGTTGGRAPLGVSPFRICHDYYLSFP